MEFSPTSSQYPSQSRVAARAGFCDEWEKTPSLMENHEKCIFSRVNMAMLLPIIIRRCIYWCQSAEMEISPPVYIDHWQHSVARENSSPGKNWGYSPSIRQQAQAVTHPSTNPYQCFLTCRIWLRTVCTMQSHHWSCSTSWDTSWVITFITCHILLINEMYIAHTPLNAYLQA